jgi:D-alanyl-lipoteichoic acid acyltransferase DltB (MBOAT superfamily)
MSSKTKKRIDTRDRKKIIFASSFFYLYWINQAWSFLFAFVLILNFYYKTSNFKKIKPSQMVMLNVFLWLGLKVFNGSMILGGSVLFPLAFSIFILQQVTFLLSNDALVNGVGFLDFGLYSIFFGNISTGPIWNFNEFISNTKSIYLRSDKIHKGIWMILFAFARKCIVVNNLANITYFLNDNTTEFTGNLLIPVLINKYELYLNFLSYSEIAIGIGLLFGFELIPNFNHPFYTTSISQFWKRWNITFINWIREYVFYPLLLTPLAKFGVNFLVLITFVVFGLWHDLTWNHFIYGIIQFLLILIERKYLNRIKINLSGGLLKIYLFTKWILFYVFFLSLPALFFKLPTLKSVSRIFINLLSKPIFTTLDSYKYISINIVLFIALTVLFELLSYKLNLDTVSAYLKTQGLVKKMLFLFAYIIFIVLLGEWGNVTSFVYSRY